MNEMKRSFSALRRRHKATGLDFINTELDLAITFCASAASTQSSERADRNLMNAKTAYYSALHFIERLRIDDDPDGTRQVIGEKLTNLKACLGQLGVNV